MENFWEVFRGKVNGEKEEEEVLECRDNRQINTGFAGDKMTAPMGQSNVECRLFSFIKC